MKGVLEEEGADFYDTGLSTWWFKPSPDACGEVAYMSVNTNQWGTEVGAYHTQFGGDLRYYGGPEKMHKGADDCYVGYIK
jgi:hypothetical protein